MADIKQAAKWMQEGKRVRRGPAHEHQRIYRQDEFHFLVCSLNGSEEDSSDPMLDVIALLADDWEIAE